MLALGLLCLAFPLSHATQCATDGSDFSYSETISGTSRIIQSNLCPNHPYKSLNPNKPGKVATTYTVPAYPQYVSTGTADLTAQGGVVGMTFSGVMLYSPYAGTSYGTVTGYNNSATSGEGKTFDMCGAHADQGSFYHYHVPPDCLLQQLGMTSGTHSPQIGWAADGFPVYGPLGESGTLMQTCTITGGTYGTSICTNANGGYYKQLSSVDNFVFRYYTLGTYTTGLTCTTPRGNLPNASFYPDTPTLYYGCCPSGVTCSASFLPICNSSAVNGYTSSYSPSAKSSLSLNCAACWTSSDNAATPSSCSSTSSPSPKSGAMPLTPPWALIAVLLLALTRVL